MRKEPLVTGEYYHIYNRGVDKRDIFNNLKDVVRFKESIKQFNQIEAIGSLEMYHKSISARALNPHRSPHRGQSEPLVAIIAFCINPNHFHFLLKQLVDGGITKFLQKFQGGYTSYFNFRHNRSGALFQGTFKSKLIKNDSYFRKTFAYVNKNYNIHNIPKNKIQFVFASDEEYESGNFYFVSKIEGKKILQVFGGGKGLKKHCNEVINLIREERGKTSLTEPDELPQ